MKEQVDEIMRLASLMATARCRRLAMSRSGQADDPKILSNVETTTAVLRKVVEELVDASCKSN